MKKALDEITIEGVIYAKCCIPGFKYALCETPCDYCAEAVRTECVGYPSSEAFCGDEDQVCYVDFEKATEENN